jgi:hypothetical protein
MLTLAAASYAIDVIAHKAKPAIWTGEELNQQQFQDSKRST